MTISAAVREASEHLDKWMRREPWCGRLHSFQDEAFSDIADILETSVAEILQRGAREGWGIILSDILVDFFFELDFPDAPTNVVDDYLQRRGWKETRVVREYLQGVRSGRFSLYQVEAVEPGVSMTVVDKVRNLPAVAVAEVLGSKCVSAGQYILAKAVQVSGQSYFSGPFLFLRPSDALKWIDEITETLEADEEKSEASVNALLQELTIDLFADAVDFIMSPFPTITNMQGESLLFTEIRFPILDKDVVVAGLDSWPDLDKQETEKGDLWVWLAPQANFKDSFTILGDMTIQGKWLKAGVNSKERGESLLARLQEAFPEALGKPVVSHQSFESAMRETDDQAESFQPILDPDILNEVIGPRLEEHYRQTLETEIPMLKNQTPRDAVKTTAGRNLVIEWLAHLESNHRKSTTMPAYSFDWMWQELGISMFEEPKRDR